VAFNPKQGQLQAWLMPDMQANIFQIFLNYFAAESQESRILILDGAPAHRSQLKLPETEPLQFRLPYSPEVNLVERLFQEIKKNLKQ
jgi:transposase